VLPLVGSVGLHPLSPPIPIVPPVPPIPAEPPEPPLPVDTVDPPHEPMVKAHPTRTMAEAKNALFMGLSYRAEPIGANAPRGVGVQDERVESGAYLYLAARRDGPRSVLAIHCSMDDAHRASAEKVRSRIECGSHDRRMFRAALLSVPPAIRDAWLDLVFGLGDLPNDGPELPRGCVPYVPSSVDALLRIVEQAPVRASDIFVDVGSGLGRAAALVHLLTGAAVIGLEIQPHLVTGARDLAARLFLSRISCIKGDAATFAGYIPIGSVFFLYCPSVANAWRECWEVWSLLRGRGTFASAALICLCPRAPS